MSRATLHDSPACVRTSAPATRNNREECHSDPARLASALACLLCVSDDIGALLQAYTREAKALEERFRRKDAEWVKQMDHLEEQQQQLLLGVGVRSRPHCPERTLDT